MGTAYQLAKENDGMKEELLKYRSLYGDLDGALSAEELADAPHSRETELKVHLKLVEEEANSVEPHRGAGGGEPRPAGRADDIKTTRRPRLQRPAWALCWLWLWEESARPRPGRHLQLRRGSRKVTALLRESWRIRTSCCWS